MGTFTYSPEINSALTYSGPGNSGSGNLGSGNHGSENLGAGNSGQFNIGFGNGGNGNIGFGNSGDDIVPAMMQLTQAMAAFGAANGALDTSSPLGQHNALAPPGMVFAATGQAHP